jgi:1,4-dihydroxy-2-naphthoyl-CoA synthase
MIPFVAVAKDKGGDSAACTKGQVEVAQKAADYHGEDRIKRLIEADLQRARREEEEGDADECVEALDHAGKLIRGEF